MSPPRNDLEISAGARKIRARCTAPGLEHNLHLDISSAASSAPEDIVKIDLPVPGPPFPKMQVCKDTQLRKLNRDSTEHFQQCYYVDELPVEDLDKIQKELGMAGQKAARQGLRRQNNLPHSDSPPHSEAELHQLWEKCAPMEDVEFTDKDGQMTTRNDTHRKCLAKDCTFLSYCEIRYQEGSGQSPQTKLFSHSCCSRFCQLALSCEVAAVSKTAGQGSCFMYPEVTEIPLMTPKGYAVWAKRWNKEAKSRKVIADAFETYKQMYGEESAAEVVSLSRQHPNTSDKLPEGCIKPAPYIEGQPPAVNSGEGHGGTSPKSTIRSHNWASTREAVRNTGPECPPINQQTFDRTLWASTRTAVETGGETMKADDEMLRTGNAPVVTNMVLVQRPSRHDDLHAEENHTCDTVHLPSMEYGRKEFSKSITDKRRNSRESERRNLLDRRAAQEKGSAKGKRHSLFASPTQLRRDLEKQILQEQAFQDQPLNSEIPHFSTFTDHHCAAGTQRLFIKGASKDSNIPQRFMPVKTAFDIDGIQLFDYCQRNELLQNPEISEVFGLDIPPKRTLGEKPENLAGSKIEPCDMHDIQKAGFEPDTLIEKPKIIMVGPVENSDTSIESTAPTGKDTRERGNSETNSRGREKHSNSLTKSEKPSYASKPRGSTRRNEQSDSESDGNKRRRIEIKHEDAIAGDTSDTDDYEASSWDGSSDEKNPKRSSRYRRKPSKSSERNSDSESEEGIWLDTASDSDDSSSESDLDVRASQRKSYRRKRAEERNRRPTKHERNKRRSRSDSPIPSGHGHRSSRSHNKSTELPKERERSRSPVGRSQSRSPTRNPSKKDKRSKKTEPPWRADFEKWSRKNASKRPKASRRDERNRKEKREKTVSKKKNRRSEQRESLSSLGGIEETEHVYLSTMTFDMITHTGETSDGSQSEADEMKTETATLAASSSTYSSSDSGTSGDSEPPKEFFDTLLEQPEHRARIEESGMTRALYLEKVIKAPNTELGDMYYDLAKKRYQDREKEKVPRSLQYPERLSENAKFKAGSNIDSIQWRKLFMSECAFVKEVYLTPLCLRSALDPKVASAVRANFSREKFKGQYEAERSDFIPFDSICRFLKKTYDRPGRKEAALLDYLTLYQGKGSVRDLITLRTNKLSILTRLGAKPLNEDLDRALVLRALSAPLSEYITSRPHHLSYSVDEIFRIAKTRELAVNNASRSSRNESLNSMERRGGSNFRNRSAPNPRAKSKGNGRFSQKGHLNAAIHKNNNRNSNKVRHPHRAALFAFGNDNGQRVSTRLFRTNYSNAEWNIRVGPDGRIKPGVNPKDPRHRNSFNKDTVNGKPWCLICKQAGHDMISCRAPSQNGGGGRAKGKGKGKGKGGNKGGGRGRNSR